MDTIINKLPNLNNNKSEENLFVKNIIVNKDKNKKLNIPYIATERWLEQLGNRLEITY